MESPYNYVLEFFGKLGDINNPWGYHISQEIEGRESQEFGFNFFEVVYALPLDGHFILIKREDYFSGRRDRPIGIRNFNEVEEIEEILYEEIKSIVPAFETKFNNGKFEFIRKVKDTTKR